MSLLADLFSFHGRMSRRAYLWHGTRIIPVAMLLMFLGVIPIAIFHLTWPFSVGFGLAILVSAAASISAMVRRLHDRGLSGWWALPPTMIVVPFLYVVFWDARSAGQIVQWVGWTAFGLAVLISLAMQILVFLPTGTTANRYGPPTVD